MDNTTAYTPDPTILQQLQAVSLAAIVGPTAVGKSTVISAAMRLNPDIHLVLNNTSRSPRPGEQDGVDYVFHTRQEMLELMERREFVQVAPSLLDELYATKLDSYATDGVAVMAILAQAMPTFRALPFKVVRSISIVPPDYETWQARIAQHGFTPEHLKKRLAEAADSLDFVLHDEATRIVINENIDDAAEDFVTLALGREMSPRLRADQPRGRQIVRLLFDRLRAEL